MPPERNKWKRRPPITMHFMGPWKALRRNPAFRKLWHGNWEASEPKGTRKRLEGAYRTTVRLDRAAQAGADTGEYRSNLGLTEIQRNYGLTLGRFAQAMLPTHGDRLRVLDIGAGHGRLLAELRQQLGQEKVEAHATGLARPPQAEQFLGPGKYKQGVFARSHRTWFPPRSLDLITSIRGETADFIDVQSIARSLSDHGVALLDVGAVDAMELVALRAEAEKAGLKLRCVSAVLQRANKKRSTINLLRAGERALPLTAQVETMFVLMHRHHLDPRIQNAISKDLVDVKGWDRIRIGL